MASMAASSEGDTSPASSVSVMAGGPQDATRHAGQVVRRVLLRRTIIIDAETAQAAAVQAALLGGGPSKPPRRRPRTPASDCEPLFCPAATGLI